jgi:homoserine dehydrogenase
MIKVAIMGYGTIGSGVFEVIQKNQNVLNKALGDKVEVKKILDLRSFAGTPAEKLVVHDFQEIADDGEISIVVETMGGTDPAYSYVKTCLERGKHVITSNKALVADAGTELLKIAREHKVNFFFEASVGGGIPVIRTIADGYAGQQIDEITGILNGTTNYILTKMDEEGESFEEALREAQQLGYAERNPQADIEGMDTCRKIAILASLMTDREVNFEDIYTEGISNIDKTDFEYAQKMGTSIKLFGSAFQQDEKLYAYVCPVMIGRPHPLYAVRDVYNGVVIRGNMLGVTMLYGSGAGKLPTASAIIADIIDISKHLHMNIPFGWHEGKIKPEIMDKTSHRYFVRFSGRNPEAMERAERVFGQSKAFYLEGKDEFAILTGYMREKDYLAVSIGIPNIIKMIRAESE